jgi:hypothetical protein
MITKVNGGDPKSEAGKNHHHKSAPVIFTIEEQNKRRDRAVKAGKYINEVGAEQHDF